MMNCCILTIGDELLQGFTVDTNSSWLSKNLYPYSIKTTNVMTVGDDLESIHSALSIITNNKYDFVFITGGLGPTHDDITVEAFQQFFNLNKSIDKDYLYKLNKKFENRGIEMPKINKNQAIVLDECEILNNSFGTARGLFYKYHKISFFILPGVPLEVRGIFNTEIKRAYLPSNESINIKIIKTTGCPESTLSSQIEDLFNSKFKIAFLPHFTGVDIKLEDIRNGNREKNIFKELCDKIYKKTKPFSYGWGSDTLQLIVINLIKEKKKTIAVAESCTGGLLSKMITDVQGSSKVFLGGIVAYSNDIKNSILGVNQNTISNFGAVSKETAREMALGIRKMYKSKIGVGITGISGPDGGSKSKPVGLVFICISYKDKYYDKEFIFAYGRDNHRKMTAQTALNMIRLKNDIIN